ncbi:MAG: rod shape-determining protein RodA [Synergistales bacterium]
MKLGEEKGNILRLLFVLSDRNLLSAAVGLFLVGLFSIFSAGLGMEKNAGAFVIRQATWGAVSFAAYVAVLRIGYSRLLDWAYRIYGIVMILLFFVLILGHAAKGAQSWIGFRGIRFQPTELAKVALGLFLAKHLCRHPVEEAKDLVGVLGLAGISLILVLLQPDLGSAIVLSVMIFTALYAAGTPVRHLLGLCGAALSTLPVAWHFLKTYQKLRLMVFLNPYIDPLGAGYNVIQSRIAVGSGRLVGKGYMLGTQSKLGFLPEPHTDFIFSVFAEEFGFLGGIALLGLFFFLLWRILAAGVKSRDLRGKVLVASIAGWIWFQVLEGMAMSMGLAPVTGLPLPFLSYGGSSLLGLGIALGLVQSVVVENPRPDDDS